MGLWCSMYKGQNITDPMAQAGSEGWVWTTSLLAVMIHRIPPLRA